MQLSGCVRHWRTGMEIYPGFSMPLWSIITIISAVAALLVFLIIRVYLNYAFLKKCDRALNDTESMTELRAMPSDRLLRRSRLIEKAAERNGIELISAVGLDVIWEKQFLVYRKTKYLRKFVKYFQEKGLFFCILGGKNKPAVEKIFVKTLSQSSDPNLLKKIATACAGTDFDGEYASGITGDRFQELTELTGDSEWPVRFFAVKLLLYIDDQRAERIIWDAFRDPSAVIRRAAAAEFKPDDTSRLSARLKGLLLDDPAYRVRKAARIRLDSDFPEYYRIQADSLTKPQTIHVLGLLHEGSDEDENTAIEFLQSEDLEIRLQAALHLQQQGSLVRLFAGVPAGDKAEYERVRNLLKKACEVNCTEFLKELENTVNPAAVQLSAELLKKNGNRSFIDKLAEKVFTDSFRESSREHYLEIYREAVECISLRGTDRALELLNRELKNRHGDMELAAVILPMLPVRGDSVFIPTLISLLKSESFADAALLRSTIERFPASMYIADLIAILRSSPEQYSLAVRKEAFKVLGELKLPCCLQMILEHLKLLSSSEQKEFAAILTSFDEEKFSERVEGLLESCDSETKCAVMSALPVTGLKKFVKVIKDSAKDPDPDVRIAGIWALAGYGETKLISQMTDMLRDPVERVRRETASVIAEYGTPSAMEELKAVLSDENEVLPVKSAAVYGFGKSGRTESINILVDFMEDPELRPLIIKALSGKTAKGEIRLMVELFKDAAPQLREYIAEAFKGMGESSESAIIELLSEEIASLRDILSEILLKTGYVESTVRKLRHRMPEKRKEAAATLALMQTKEAFKGMVLAARDPDSDVRVEVLKALEKLNTPDGEPILSALKEDPDKRVRKYTLWALERLQAKNTEAG